MSARVRTVVVCPAVLFAGFVSKPAMVSSDEAAAMFWAGPFVTPRIVTVITCDCPAPRVGQLQTSVPPTAPTAGTVPQLPPPVTLTPWKDSRPVGSVSVRVAFSATEGPLLRIVTV